MPKSSRTFNEGSIIPSILTMEAEFIERENEEQKLAGEKMQTAKFSCDKLIEDTVKELPAIEEKERKKLLDEVDASADELRKKEERELRGLERNIEHNRRKVLDLILNKVIPDWDGRYPD